MRINIEAENKVSITNQIKIISKESVNTKRISSFHELLKEKIKFSDLKKAVSVGNKIFVQL